jgi:Na+/proline symporter
MHFLDYLVIIAYLAFIVGMGAYFGRHQSRREYFAASGSMGVMAVGLSVMATLFSSNSFVMYPSAAYGTSLTVGAVMISFTLMTPLVMWVFIPMFRRLKCPTAHQYLERRFHVSVRCLAGGLFVFLRIAWMASATYAASLVMASVSGFSQVHVIIALGGVSILYTMMGGLRAVMWTDVVQFFVFAVTIVLVAALLVSSQDSGGVTGIVGSYFEGRKHVVFDFTPSMTLKFGTLAVLTGVFLEGLSAFGADQVAVQRYISAKSERTAKLGALLNLGGMWLVMPSLLFIGMALHVLFEKHPQELVPVIAQKLEATPVPDLPESIQQRPEWNLAASEKPSGEKLGAYYSANPGSVKQDMLALGLDDQALPRFVELHFPPGLTGLFLAALMAAIMSSIDSGIHSITTVLIVDFRDRLKPEWKPKREKDDVKIIRILVVLIGAIAVVLACMVRNLGDVFSVGKLLTSGFGGPLLAVFILAFFSPRVSTRGVFLGVFSATAITIYLMVAHPHWFAVWFWPIGFCLSLGLTWILSLFLKDSSSVAGAKGNTFRAVMARHSKAIDETQDP